MTAATILVADDDSAIRTVLNHALGRCGYRVRTTGQENIPQDGPAVIVCNHVSFMDPLILGGSIRSGSPQCSLLRAVPRRPGGARWS